MTRPLGKIGRRGGCLRACIAAGTAAWLLIPVAHAALGGDAASITVDRTALAPSGSGASASASNTAVGNTPNALSAVVHGASAADPASAAAVTAATVTATTTTGTPYTVASLTTDAGTIVREYMTGDGTVFAITWAGPTRPDLRQLLGTYFETARQASAAATASAPPAMRGARTLRSDQLIVRSSGGMRLYTGSAYLQNKLPSGMTADQLR